MANNVTVHVVRARLDWAKVLGEPRFNRFSEEREWSVDATPLRSEDKALLKRLGVDKKLKEPREGDERKEKFLSFRQKEFRIDKKTGEKKRQPIKIVDVAGKAWPENGSLIGNGTIADVKFNVRDYGIGKQKGVYIQAIRVLDLVPYEAQEFAPLTEDDEYFASAAEDESWEKDTEEEAQSEDLDDEIPF